MIESFFDKFDNETDTKNMTLLKKLDPEPKISKSEEILFGRFLVRGEKFGQFHDRWLQLTNGFLHVFEDEKCTQYMGTFALHNMRNEYFSEDNPKKYGIKVTKH